jgi:hypothetical protein
MDLGSYRLGQEVRLCCLCVDSSGAPAAPDACPAVDVYGDSSKALSARLPPAERPASLAPGLFALAVLLDGRFAEGRYRAAFRWDVGGTRGGSEATFEVVGGGGETGQVLALFSYERPQADHLVQQRSSGRLYKGRNPRV